MLGTMKATSLMYSIEDGYKAKEKLTKLQLDNLNEYVNALIAFLVRLLRQRELSLST